MLESWLVFAIIELAIFMFVLLWYNKLSYGIFIRIMNFVFCFLP